MSASPSAAAEDAINSYEAETSGSEGESLEASDDALDTAPASNTRAQSTGKKTKTKKKSSLVASQQDLEKLQKENAKILADRKKDKAQMRRIEAMIAGKQQASETADDEQSEDEVVQPTPAKKRKAASKKAARKQQSSSSESSDSDSEDEAPAKQKSEKKVNIIDARARAVKKLNRSELKLFNSDLRPSDKAADAPDITTISALRDCMFTFITEISNSKDHTRSERLKAIGYLANVGTLVASYKQFDSCTKVLLDIDLYCRRSPNWELNPEDRQVVQYTLELNRRASQPLPSDTPSFSRATSNRAPRAGGKSTNTPSKPSNGKPCWRYNGSVNGREWVSTSSCDKGASCGFLHKCIICSGGHPKSDNSDCSKVTPQVGKQHHA